MDAEEYLTLYEQVPRVQAMQALTLIQAVSLGMNGGDEAQETIDEYTRRVKQEPKLRMKRELEFALAAMGMGGRKIEKAE